MLARIRKAQQEREGGFTLIELLIVIVVLGILAGIVVFGLGTFKSDSQAAACKADVKQVQTAYDAYVAKNDTAPTAIDGAAPDTLVGAGLLKSAPGATEGIALPVTLGGFVTSTTCP